MVAPLLAAGADPNDNDSQGPSALLMAAEQGQLGIVRQLLAAGALAGVRSSDGRTALHEAAARCHTAVVRLLLEHGLQVDCVDVHGSTVLDCAAAAGAPVELLRLLLGKSAEPAAVAASRALLGAAGADATTADAVAYLLAQGADVTAKGPAGTALHAAAAVGNTEAVQLLLQAGADHSALSERGSMPLCDAAAGGYVEVVQQLLAAGAAVDAPGAADSNNPLLLAAVSGHTGVVQVLLAAGAAMAIVSDGLTAVLAAVRAGSAACVRLLLKAGADPTQGNLHKVFVGTGAGVGVMQAMRQQAQLHRVVEALRELLSWAEPAVDLDTVLDAADTQQDLAPVLLCHVAQKDPEAAAGFLSDRVHDFDILDEPFILQPGQQGLGAQQWWQCAGKYLTVLTRSMLRAWAADKVELDVQWRAIAAKERDAAALCAEVRQLAVAVALGTDQQQSQQQEDPEW